MPVMHKLSPRQWTVLVLLTLVWGVNWPIMKIGVTGFPPLTFRALCMWLGVKREDLIKPLKKDNDPSDENAGAVV